MTDFDSKTIAFYDREAIAYAAWTDHPVSKALLDFVARLKPGARILELGTGPGRDAEFLLNAGFAVDATDGSALLAALASWRIGDLVRVMRFDELDAENVYDGVWANACLLHAPMDALPGILSRIRHALKPGGIFHSNYKAGAGGERDSLGRYYNFPSRPALESAFASAGPWSELIFDERKVDKGGYDGVARTWLSALAVR